MNDSLELVFAGKKAFARNPLPRKPQGNSIWHGASSPSPRLPSGRLRPSSTGYGEGRGEGAFPHAQTRGEAPSPGMSAKDALIPTSPRKRGEVKAVPDAKYSRNGASMAYLLTMRPEELLTPTPAGLCC